MFDEPCRRCGTKLGDDQRSFKFEGGKKPICFDCEIKRLPKKTLIKALLILVKIGSFAHRHKEGSPEKDFEKIEEPPKKSTNLIKITFEYDDSIETLEGAEMERWVDKVNSNLMTSIVHGGSDFADFKWKVIKK